MYIVENRGFVYVPKIFAYPNLVILSVTTIWETQWPFKVLQPLPSVLILSMDISIHLIFHGSHLKELLGSYGNIVTIEDLVNHEYLSANVHFMENNLNVVTKHLGTREPNG